MATKPRDPLALVLRNAEVLARVHNAIARDSRGILRALFDDIVAELARLDPTAVQPRYRRERVEQLLRRVADLNGVAYDDWYRTVRGGLYRAGKAQRGRAVRIVEQALDAEIGARFTRRGPRLRLRTPPASWIRTIVETNPFEGDTLRQWAETQELRTLRDVRRVIQAGVLRGKSLDEMVRDIRGRAAGPPIRDASGRLAGRELVGGVLQVTTRQAEAIITTALTDVATQVMLATYRAAGPEVTTHWRWITQEDERVCPRCGPLHDRTFAYDDVAAPRPPAHFVCRCGPAPVILPGAVLPERGPDGSWPEWVAELADGPRFRTIPELRAWRTAFLERHGGSDDLLTFVEAATRWHHPDEVWPLRAAVRAAQLGEAVEPAGRAMLAALRAAEPTAPQLYRGFSASEADMAKYVEGGEMLLAVSSFSEDRTIARGYARRNVSVERPLAVELVLHQGGRAVRIDAFSPTVPRLMEREWISAGAYRIVRLKRRGTRLTITLEQEEGP